MNTGSETHGTELLGHTQAADPARAHVRVDPATRSSYQISPYLLGKFCEHLGSNIYHGMEAQILVNPTFGHWPFSAGDGGGDGGMRPDADFEHWRSNTNIFAERFGLSEANTLADDLLSGGALGWMRSGGKDTVILSPDSDPYGGRAQRVEVSGNGGTPCGLVQWTYLPLHRTRRYEFAVTARAARAVRVTLSLAPLEANGIPGNALCATAWDVPEEWHTESGVLEIPASVDIDPHGLFVVLLTVTEDANLVFSRALLYPDDHVGHADPDVIWMLRESGLPLLRWPGGNFVSGYDWRDGIGPLDRRPTRPNPAWSGLEYNLFGTAEFVAFCRAVGCEPMICVNAGDGTPAEAAAWVEYCNGGPETAMGRLRAEHGFSKPFGVRLWEVGNELFGNWQVHWTTPGGHVDRYRRFAAVMRAADPNIELLACGYPWWPGDAWDRTLIAEIGPELRCLTDHILTGGSVSAKTPPAELYHAFMGQATDIGQRYRAVAERMRAAGNPEPRLAVTELQLFAHFDAATSEETPPDDALSQKTMPTPATISEALYFASIFHECVRTEGLVEMITHSATVNHGGGLRKARERVWANPVHYAHALLRPIAGGRPVCAEVDSAAFSTEMAFHGMPTLTDVPALDVLATLSEDESVLFLTILHRASEIGPITATLDVSAFTDDAEANVCSLSGKTMWDANTAEEPERVAPQYSTLRVTDGKAQIALPSYSLTRVSVPREKAG